MNQKFRSILFSLVVSLSAFWGYWRNLDDDYSGMNMLWGAFVAVILMIILYAVLEKEIERFSVAWGCGIAIAMGLVSCGVVWSLNDSLPDIYGAWGEYMFLFGFWWSLPFVVAPKKHKPYKWSFFKRARLKE